MGVGGLIVEAVAAAARQRFLAHRSSPSDLHPSRGRPPPPAPTLASSPAAREAGGPFSFPRAEPGVGRLDASTATALGGRGRLGFSRRGGLRRSRQRPFDPSPHRSSPRTLTRTPPQEPTAPPPNLYTFHAPAARVVATPASHAGPPGRHPASPHTPHRYYGASPGGGSKKNKTAGQLASKKEAEYIDKRERGAVGVSWLGVRCSLGGKEARGGGRGG